jgi:hypothetical protein
MGNAVKRFVPRAPRYVLRPEDRKTMRFSLQHTLGAAGIEETILLNLSETGAAFLAPAGMRFEMGDLIKVEIPVPNGDQVAWWGRIIRLEEYEPRQWLFSRDPFRDIAMTMVGLRFEKLPEPHTRTIRKGIERSFLQAMRDQRYRTFMYYRVLFVQNIFQILGYLALTIAAFGLLYWLSRPSENYDSKRGAPWGQRFKF